MLEDEWDAVPTQQPPPVDHFDLLSDDEVPITSTNQPHRANGDGAEVVPCGPGRKGGRDDSFENRLL